jgi:FtsZ-interacting cell division protein ZipA
MSELQLALLALGVLAVAAVWLFNRWQERQLRRRAERTLTTVDDALLTGVRSAEPGPLQPPERERGASGRVEPRLGPPAAPADAPQAAPAHEDAQRAVLESLDVQIGLNIVPRAGERLDADRLLGLIESGGFSAGGDGHYRLHDAAGCTQLELVDRKGRALVRETLSAAAGEGITLLLEVARTPRSLQAYDRMTGLARQWSEALGGALVDDGDRPLDEAGLARIRTRLEAMHERARAAGFELGDETVRRLLG